MTLLLLEGFAAPSQQVVTPRAPGVYPGATVYPDGPLNLAALLHPGPLVYPGATVYPAMPGVFAAARSTPTVTDPRDGTAAVAAAVTSAAAVS